MDFKAQKVLGFDNTIPQFSLGTKQIIPILYTPNTELEITSPSVLIKLIFPNA